MSYRKDGISVGDAAEARSRHAVQLLQQVDGLEHAFLRLSELCETLRRKPPSRADVAVAKQLVYTLTIIQFLSRGVNDLVDRVVKMLQAVDAESDTEKD